jgi:hypothetical protein
MASPIWRGMRARSGIRKSLHARQDGEARAKANSLHSRPLSSGIGHATARQDRRRKGRSVGHKQDSGPELADVIGAGDENRTRTVSLGS